MKSLEQMKEEWETLDKTNFVSMEIDYDESDPKYIALKDLAEKANMKIEDLISKLIIEWFENNEIQ